MKHIKTYENRYQKTNPKRDSVALYFEEEQPVSKEDGFIECLYGENFEFSFYFKFWTDEESFTEFYKFLEDNDLEVYDEKSIKPDKYEIIIKLSQYKINKFAKLHDDMKKYNL